MPMAMSMRDSGKMIKLMALGDIHMPMEQFTKENGS
jgi:hypothetical protein